jgi:hypothetical protein
MQIRDRKRNLDASGHAKVYKFDPMIIWESGAPHQAPQYAPGDRAPDRP